MFPGIVNTSVVIWGEKKRFEQRGPPPPLSLLPGMLETDQIMATQTETEDIRAIGVMK